MQHISLHAASEVVALLIDSLLYSIIKLGTVGLPTSLERLSMTTSTITITIQTSRIVSVLVVANLI